MLMNVKAAIKLKMPFSKSVTVTNSYFYLS